MFLWEHCQPALSERSVWHAVFYRPPHCCVGTKTLHCSTGILNIILIIVMINVTLIWVIFKQLFNNKNCAFFMAYTWGYILYLLELKGLAKAYHACICTHHHTPWGHKDKLLGIKVSPHLWLFWLQKNQSCLFDFSKVNKVRVAYPGFKHTNPWLESEGFWLNYNEIGNKN